MRRLAAGLLVLALAAVSLDAGAGTEIRRWQGAERLPLAAAALDGRRVDLRQLQGRVVLVNFWATWCEPCRAEMPSIERLRARLEGRPFEVLAVNYGESREKVAQFLQHEHVALPVLLDPDKEVGDAWNAKGLPMTFLVDVRGRVRYWAFGEMDWSRGEALKVVEKLVAEAPGA
ncbi:MAG TPA: TlpA disulfide reductase family protein [Usitatibacter sp.]|jgi:thiol-disulfide isomerase/thioredoxin|nr:TlpA disulfide reductase family protein [Usitatibacter sp.]